MVSGSALLLPVCLLALLAAALLPVPSDAFITGLQKHARSVSSSSSTNTALHAKKKGPPKPRPKGTPLNVDVVRNIKVAEPSVLPELPKVSADAKPQPPQPRQQQESQSQQQPAAAGAAEPQGAYGAAAAGGADIPEVVPRLVVLDLDATCWLPEMYQIRGAPFRLSAGKLLDREGTQIVLRPGVKAALEELHTHPSFASTRIAAASRTSRGTWSRAVMDMMVIFDGLVMSELFDFVEIQQGDKTAHFENLREESKVPFDEQGNKKVHFENLRQKPKVPFDEMLFYDDWDRNIKDVSALGVTSVHCPEGLTIEAWRQGLQKYASRKVRP